MRRGARPAHAARGPLHGCYATRLTSARHGPRGSHHLVFGSDCMKHRAIFGCLAAAFAVVTAASADDHDGDRHNDGAFTATPIKHLVVIFQENVSFDHYFGTYPV